MNRLATLLIAAGCLAVLLAAPFACAGAACAAASDAGWAADGHDDGPQATVKPAASLPAPAQVPSLMYVAAQLAAPEPVSEPRTFSAGLPLRI